MKITTHRQMSASMGLAALAGILGSMIALAQTTPAASSASTGAAAATAAPRPQRQGGGGGGIFLEKSFPVIDSGPWTGRRLPDGQPDIAGDWSNTVGNHNNFTDPQGGIPGDPTTRNRTLGPRDERAPSRVSDPADGQLPYQPWARAKQQELAAGLWNAVKQEYIEPLDRCAPGGVPKIFTHTGYEIRQYPGRILFIFDSSWRLIYLDHPKHPPENLKLWNGDSRGHWEGNTLVVDVSNDNAKARFARTADFASENVHVVERYVFSPDGKRYNYVATFTDPTVFTRPFTVTIPSKRWTLDEPRNGWHYQAREANNPGGPRIADHYERICVENNGGFGQVAITANKSN